MTEPTNTVSPVIHVKISEDADIDVESPLSIFDTLATLQLALYKVSAIHFNYVAQQKQAKAQQQPQLFIPSVDPRMVKQRG